MSKKKRKKRGQGEGGIYQREDGRWCGQLSLGYDEATGKRIRATVYGDSRLEVVQKLDQKKREFEEKAEAETDITVARFLDIWFDCHKHSWSAATVTRYRNHVATVSSALGRVRLDQLTGMHVTGMYQRLSAAGARSNKIRQAGICLRQVLAYAARLRYVKRNAAADVPLPRHHKNEIRPLSVEQSLALVDGAWPTHIGPLIVVALDTGARQGELFALTWDDYDVTRGTLSLVKSLEGDAVAGRRVKETKSRHSRRVIPLGALARQALALQRERQPTGHVIFTAPLGGYWHPSNFRVKWFKPLLARLGLPDIRFHDLRHTYATLALAAGLDIRTIADRLGHANTRQLLQTYAHVLPAMRDRAAGVLDGVVGDSNVGSNL